MNSPVTSATATNTRMYGRLLVSARIVWVVTATLALIVVLAGSVDPQAFCGKIVCSVVGPFNSGDLVYALISSVFPVALWIVIGVLLFLRKSDDWMVCLVSLAFVIVGVCTLTDNLAFYANQQQINGPVLWQFAPLSLYLLKSELILFSIALLPNGRFVPLWTRVIPLIYLIYVLIYLVLPVIHLPGWTLFNNPINGILWFGCEGCLIIMQIYRYVRRSGSVARQQIKWILFSLIVVVLADVGGTALINLLPLTPLLGSIANGLFNYTILVFPISLMMALLRYRLWEIDTIINRALVYGLLTALLALVYIGLIIGLQFLLSSFTKNPSGVAIVGSTLGIAALFQPFRKGLQTFIDRRFYRQKYNASKILATFSTSLREEVDLIQLHEHLVAVVEESMQPTHVSLWLRTEPGKKREAARISTPPAS